MRKLFLMGAAVLGLALAACSGGASSTIPQQSTAQQITVDASEFKFEPATVQVTAGRPVKIVFRNKGSVEHDWSVMKVPVTGKKESAGGHSMGSTAEEPAVHVSAVSGRNGELEFTPTAAGTYELWCTVPGHKEAGMVGKFTVTSP